MTSQVDQGPIVHKRLSFPIMFKYKGLKSITMMTIFKTIIKIFILLKIIIKI